MIISRIRTTITCLFLVEIVSFAVVFLVWYFNITENEPVLTLLERQEYYKKLIFYITFITLILVLTSILRLKYEINNFTKYTTTYTHGYLLRSSLTYILIVVFMMTLASLFFPYMNIKFLFIAYLLLLMVDIMLKLAVTRLLRHIYTAKNNQRRILIVGINVRSIGFAKFIQTNPQLGFDVIGYADQGNHTENSIQPIGSLENIVKILRTNIVDIVATFLPVRSFYDTNMRIIQSSEEFGISVQYMANIFEPERAKCLFASAGSINNVVYYSAPQDSWQLKVKRLFDVVFSLTLLFFVWPIMLAVALYIKHTDKGPAFFVQPRVGYNKRIFQVYKFRTMVPDAEALQEGLQAYNEMDGPAFKITNDPRLIRGGAFLRRHSLDELPQLWNVLINDMSVVGPRPLALRDYRKLSEDWQCRRFSMKPGLTCIWQVCGRNNISFTSWMLMDLSYIDNWNLKSDFVIVMKTVLEVLKGGGK